MELRVLRYFLTVAREENITKAAQLLHMTQPTLSRQIHALEEELGTVLLERESKKVRLTEDGLLLRRQAQEILELADKARHSFGGQAEALFGQINIGAGETRNVQVLARWMTEFQKLYPLVKFSLESDTADVVHDKLARGILDIGLMMEPVDVTEYQICRMPLREQYGILLPQSHKLAAREKIYPQDLWEVQLILPRRLPVRSYLHNWFGERFEELNVVATVDLWFNSTFLIKSGMGIELCCDICEETDSLTQDMGLAFRPLADIPPIGAVLAWKKQMLSRAARVFLDYCREQARLEVKA